MSELAIVVQATLPVFVLVGLGALLRRLRWLTTAADTSLLVLTVNLLTPCLILDKVLGSAALARASTVLLAPAVGFVVVGLSVAVSFAAAHLFGIRTEPIRRTFAFSTGLQNYGYFPLPLALTLYGDDTAAVLFVHNLGVETALWTIGIVVLAGIPWRAALRRVLSPPAIAIVAAVVLNVTVGRDGIPTFVMESVTLIGSAAIPLGLLLTGATMADHARNVGGAGSVRTVLLSCALRLGILPLFYCLALWGLNADIELERVFVLQAAMPAAVIPIILAKHYRGDSITALRIVFATTFVSLLTLPMWIHFASRWLGPD
jgi:malate permease and related proteins